jgi:hypothetical protein
MKLKYEDPAENLPFVNLRQREFYMAFEPSFFGVTRHK